MKKTVSITELKEILTSMPKIQIEKECNAWGCCTPHYEYVVDPDNVLYQVTEYLKKKDADKSSKSKKK